MAANVSVPNTFTNSTTADAAQVNANYTALVSWINTNAMHLDGTKPFTAVPSGPATTPTASTHLTTKAYVDSVVAPYVTTASFTATFPQFGTIYFMRGIRITTNITSLSASGSGMMVGDLAYDSTSNMYYFNTGTLWKTLLPQRGTINVSVAVSGGRVQGNITITFPIAFTTASPVVVASYSTALSGFFTVRQTALSATSVSYNVACTDTTNVTPGTVTVNWIAMEN